MAIKFPPDMAEEAKREELMEDDVMFSLKKSIQLINQARRHIDEVILYNLNKQSAKDGVVFVATKYHEASTTIDNALAYMLQTLQYARGIEQIAKDLADKTGGKKSVLGKNEMATVNYFDKIADSIDTERARLRGANTALENALKMDQALLFSKYRNIAENLRKDLRIIVDKLTTFLKMIIELKKLMNKIELFAGVSPAFKR